MPPRNKFVQIRVTQDEKATLDALALQCGSSITDILLDSMRSYTVSKNLSSEYLIHLKLVRRELVRQGNNINQIAHALNRHQILIDSELLQHYFDTLVEGEVARQSAIECVVAEIMRCKRFGVS